MIAARAWLALAALALAACGQDADPAADAGAEAQAPVVAAPAGAPEGAPAIDDGGTPLEERVATLGFLNKRNNVSQDIELRPGQSRRIDDVIVRLATCERTPPWELPEETGAFVQVLVQRADDPETFARVFSGWLFANAPSVNVVEHPIYDVWVKDCAMSFPGEEGTAPSVPAASETT